MILKHPLSITESPVSTAALGLVSDTRGLSVRFPRFIKVRLDKKTEQASTPEFLASMWRKQQKAPVVAGADDGELIDVNLSEASCSELEEDESDAQGVDD
jgi:DNA ligase-1